MIRRLVSTLVVSVSLVALFSSCSGSGPASAPGIRSEVARLEPNDVSSVGDRIDADGRTEAQTARADDAIAPSSLPQSSVAANGTEESAPAVAKAKRPDIYDTNADAAASVAAALERAKKNNKRVLVMYGGNWCGWCYKLHDVFEKNREIAIPLRNEYERVMVDVGRFDKNMELATSYGADLKAHGVPYLTVLDADGKVLANQDTGELEDGPAHDPQKVKDFLTQWAVEPLDAEQVLSGALARAKQEDKRLFVHLGAPWCGWCHRLEDFLHDNAAFFEADYLLVKIDLDRMTHGKAVAEQLRGTLDGGIPWIAVLDSDGQKLVTSDGPAGNTGYPAEPQEIDHFIAMLQATAKHMNAEQVDQVRSVLSDAAKKYLSH
jgi:thiol-disulfide isomerase/thioredoxin